MPRLLAIDYAYKAQLINLNIVGAKLFRPCLVNFFRTPFFIGTLHTHPVGLEPHSLILHFATKGWSTFTFQTLKNTFQIIFTKQFSYVASITNTLFKTNHNTLFRNFLTPLKEYFENICFFFFFSSMEANLILVIFFFFFLFFLFFFLKKKRRDVVMRLLLTKGRGMVARCSHPQQHRGSRTATPNWIE